jgi:hypothetical protein
MMLMHGLEEINMDIFSEIVKGNQLTLPFRDHQGRFVSMGGKPKESEGLGGVSAFRAGAISTANKLNSKSANEVFHVQIEGDGAGYWKPEKTDGLMEGEWNYYDIGDLGKCSQASREVMSYELDKIADAGLIPETTIKYKDNEKGSCQEEVKSFTRGDDAADYPEAMSRFLKVDKEQYLKGIAFDELIGSTDRHFKNWGIDEKNNLKFIDNGLVLARYPRKAWNGNFATYYANQNILRRVFGAGSINDVVPLSKPYKDAMIKKFIDNEDAINSMFKKNKLPADEQKSFWSRVKDQYIP